MFLSCCKIGLHIIPTASPEDHISPKTTSPPAYTTLATVPSTSTPVITMPPPTSYPAVLGGRPTSSLSDIKPKIPPPVPPRGTPKAARPNQTNGKGAEHLLYTNGNLLHDLLCLTTRSDSYCSFDVPSNDSFVISIEDSDNLNKDFKQYGFLSRSLDHPEHLAESYVGENERITQYFLPKIKRFGNYYDLNLKSSPELSDPYQKPSKDEYIESDSNQTLPKCHKKVKRVRPSCQKNFSELQKQRLTQEKKLDPGFVGSDKKTKDDTTSQLFNKETDEIYSSQSTSKTVFSQAKDSDECMSKSQDSKDNRRKFQLSANYAGTSPYSERYENIPQIIVSYSPDYHNKPTLFSPQRNYVEVYNSKLAQKNN